jgi:hypothetical protein
MKKVRISSRVRVPKVPGGFPHVVHTRLTDSQFQRIEKASEERGLTISTLLREVVVRFLTSNVAVIPPHHEDRPGIRGRERGTVDLERAYGGGGRLGRRAWRG